MNIDILRTKASDVITSIEVAMEEVIGIEAARKALENSSYVNTEREKRLNVWETTLRQKTAENEAQKKFIEEQNKLTQTVLHKITVEKESLKTLLAQRQGFEQEKLQFEADKKALEGVKQEKEALVQLRLQMDKERKLFSQEKLAMTESQKLLLLREAHIRAKEERIARIERLTSI